MADTPLQIVVTGDVAIDCNLVRRGLRQGPGANWDGRNFASYFESWGGAELLGRILHKAVANTTELGVAGPLGLPQDPSESHDNFARSYALWQPFPDDPKKPDDKKWRVAEYLGVRIPPHVHHECSRTIAQKQPPGVIVIDDANYDDGSGFSHMNSSWPDCLLEVDSPTWVVWKVWRPNSESQLWKLIYERANCPMAFILSVNGLRESGHNISKGVSWERSAQDIYAALKEEFSLHDAERSREIRAIVSLGAAGAMIFRISGEESGPRARLIYDPKCMEGEWEKKHPGHLIGLTSSMAAAVALNIARYCSGRENPPPESSWAEGIGAGLDTVRRLQAHGFDPPYTPENALVRLEFPYEQVVKPLAGLLAPKTPDAWKQPADAGDKLASKRFLMLPKGFACVVVPDPGEEHRASLVCRRDPHSHGEICGRWAMLKSRAGGAMLRLAREIVRAGMDPALPEIPIARFGKLISADRSEIESFRSIFNLLSEYVIRLQQERAPSKPVSFAVFGPPGSGKSFGVKQLAKGLQADVEEMTFNLSQFGGPGELIPAFHRVRDSRLRGKLPLVFWDEFDTTLNDTKLGWLRYFLSPMQDGEFLEGDAIHSIGPGIFVFAGGTKAAFHRFNITPEHPDFGRFKSVKGPDFVSRLRGYLDIRGPNPQGGDPVADPTFLIRRAILLRQFLAGKRELLDNPDSENATIRIDPGVLDAFLAVSCYKHGARSMESTVSVSSFSNMTSFNASCLPQSDQLDMHVPAPEFMAWVRFSHALTDRRLKTNLAKVFHENYCKSLLGRGYRYAAIDDESRKEKRCLVAFEQLEAGDLSENEGAVAAIPGKLVAAGYAVAPVSSDENAQVEEGYMERLAELEHDRWLRSKIRNGWRYAARRDNARLLHPAMLPWKALSLESRAVLYPENPEAIGLEALPENEKEKDRDQARATIEVIHGLGYRLVDVKSRAER